jgi:hypothetical protein
MSFKSFCQMDWSDFSLQRSQQILSEIKSRSKDYILNVDEGQYEKYLFKKYSIEPLEVFIYPDDISEPLKRSDSYILLICCRFSCTM